MKLNLSVLPLNNYASVSIFEKADKYSMQHRIIMRMK